MSFVSPKPTTSGLPDTPVTPPCPRILFDDTLHASPRDCLREKVVLSLNKNSSVATTDHISGGRIFLKLSDDIIVQVMSSLRAYDLGALQQTCKAFADPALANRVVKYVSAGVYPESLTAGFTTAQVSGIVSTGERLLNFKNMRDMEMLVVARVLSRPEPAEGFWVSKAWCKSALKWLEATTKTPKKNLSKRKGRIRDRRLSDALPPWPNINVDIMCEHGSLVTSSKPGAKRKVIDKKAWRVLRKLYPDSSSIPTSNGECVHCQFERLEGKRRKEKALEEGRAERKKVLAVGLVRDVYRRSKGVPEGAIRSSAAASPSTSSTRSFTSTTGVPLCSPCSSTPTSVVDLETQFSNFRINKVAGGKPTPFSPPKKLKSPVQITSWPTLEQAAKKSHVFPFSTPTQQVIGASIKKPVTAPVPLCLTPPTNLPPPPVLKMASVAPPAPVAPAPLVDGSYKILPRKFLHSWRHYIKAGGAKACLSDSPSMLCEAHGHVVVPKHLKDYLMGNTENLFGERGAEAQLDRENDCVVEVLTEREYEAFCDKFPETRRMVGYAVGFEIRGGRVEWAGGICGNCEGGEFGKTEGRVGNRLRESMSRISYREEEVVMGL